MLRYLTHTPAARESHVPAEGEPTAALEKVFVLLRAQTGNDFSCYKRNTINRRIERRMSIHQFDRLPRYIRFLQENPQEVELLYKELLIGVTNFFRDPGLFDFLKAKAIPQLLQAGRRGECVRVWSPGCSTGEETYSLAIVLKECWRSWVCRTCPAIQIFATDIDKDAIDKARRGTFSAGISAEVSPQRLDRFFVHEDEGYRVKKEIRDLVVFAPQNLLVDPPFTEGRHPLLPQPADLRQCRDPEETPAADALCLESRRAVDPGHRGGHRRTPIGCSPPWARGGKSSSARKCLNGLAWKCLPVLPRERLWAAEP